MGKLITTLLHEGKKKLVSRYLYKAFAIVKYTFKSNPLIILLEILDKIKPNFRLRNYIVRRVIVKEYPIVTLRSRQYILAIHWLKLEIQTGSDRLEASLADKIAARLIDFTRNPKKNSLVKKRTDYTKRIIAGQFNIRYA